MYVHVQWESTFKVSLHQIHWKNGEQGLEKVDLIVPIETVSYGTMLLKLSGMHT
jgi:hypothetical protein